MENLNFSYEVPEYRPALYLENVKDTRIEDLRVSGETETQSMMIIDRSQDIIVSECNALNHFEALGVIQNDSKKIGFINCNLLSKNTIYKSDESVNKSDILIK